MLKRIKPVAVYSLEIDGKETKKSPGTTVRESEEELPVRYPTKPRIKPKSDYSVEVNE